MTLSGGNYGGYVVVDTTATLTVEGEVVDTQELSAINPITINGWQYNDVGIFCGII